MYHDGAVRREILTPETTGDAIMESAPAMVCEMRLRPGDKAVIRVDRGAMGQGVTRGRGAECTADGASFATG